MQIPTMQLLSTDLRNFAVLFRDVSKLVCLDDKHYVEVSEPGMLLSAIDRGKCVLVGLNKQLMVVDHDFGKFSLIPTVLSRSHSTQARYTWV